MDIKYSLLLLVAVITGAALSYLPEFMVPIIMLLSVIVALITFKKNIYYAVIAIIFAVIGSIFVSFSIYSLVVCFASAISGLFLGYGLKNKYPLQNILIVSGGSFLLVIFLSVFVVYLLTGEYVISNSIDAHFNRVKSTYDTQMPLLNSMGLIPEDMSVSEFKDSIFAWFDTFNNMIHMILPSIFILLSGIIAYFNFGIVRIILSKQGIYFNLPTFQYLKMSKLSGMFYILAWILHYLITNQLFNLAFVNIYIVLSCLYGFCALSLIDYKLREKVNSSKIRTVIYIGGSLVAPVLILPLSTLLIILGISDSLFDFRNLQTDIKRG